MRISQSQINHKIKFDTLKVRVASMGANVRAPTFRFNIVLINRNTSIEAGSLKQP